MPAYTSVMGNEAGASDHGCQDVNSACSSFALDFGGMLDATDSVLHQQIYEYLQGPSMQPQQDLDQHHQILTSSSLDQGLQGTFPGRSSTQWLYPPSGKLSTFDPEEPPQAYTANNTHLSRPASIEYQRKDKDIGTSSGTGMQMGMCALPAQMTLSEVTFQAPVQPHLLLRNDTREFSGASPNDHLKRPGSFNELPDILNPPEPRSRSGRKKAQKIEPGQDLRSQPHAEPAEHAIRERQRRDDMTSKFVMLESLLPPGPKRDRSTIVDDSIQYVKSLHHRVKELHEKRSKMKSKAISSSIAKKATALGLNSVKKHVVAPASIKEPETITAKNPSLAASSVSESQHAELRGSLIEKIEVHMDLPHQIVIEMTCRPHGHIQSQIMATLERLGLEVSRYNISKLHNRLICVLVVKPGQDRTDPQITCNDIIGALNHAVVPD